ncbi:MAG TPA: hypothetical protein VFR06_05920 [Gallionellaceae bacterium]|nr:hypothetical protein [Gallionellaceae bacterium]
MDEAQTENGAWTALPVLTDIVDASAAALPGLTEQALQQAPDDVVEMSADEIAALLAPQLEQQLRAKLSAQFELLWQEAWQQTRATLPELIRAQLTVSAAADGKRSAS